MLKSLNSIIFRENCDSSCLDDIEVEVNVLDRDFSFLSINDDEGCTIVLNFEKAELLARNILSAINGEKIERISVSDEDDEEIDF